MNIPPEFLGADRVLKFEEKQYKVSLVTGKIKAEFERRLVAQAEERLKKRRHRYANRREYLAELRHLGEREDRGEFAFHVNTSQLATSWGQETILELLMAECPKEVRERLLDEYPDEMFWFIDRVVRDSMPVTAKKGEEDPFGPSADGSPPTA